MRAKEGLASVCVVPHPWARAIDTRDVVKDPSVDHSDRAPAVSCSFRVSEGDQHLELRPSRFLLCGYTARDQAGIMTHIEELARQGIPAPDTLPIAWRAPAHLLTNASVISVESPTTSGEVEPVLVRGHAGWHATVGSDHTDRMVERQDLQRSKLICAKPVASGTWRLESVSAYWDDLVLRSAVLLDEHWIPYQEAPLEYLLPLAQLVEIASSHLDPTPGTVVFLGTLPLKTAEFVFGNAYKLELLDPRHDRALTFTYAVSTRPDLNSNRDPKQR